MLQAILTWWVTQLRSLLPERWRDPTMRLPDALIVDGGALGAPPGDAMLVQRRRRRERRLGPLGAHPVPSAARCVLRLAGSPLQRDVTLPSAVEADLPRVLAYDMGRLAPFDAADLFWNWRIVRRDEIRKRLTIQLWYVPRRTLQPLLERLSGLGVGPDSLELVQPTGTVLRLRLRAPAPGHRRAIWMAVPAATALLALIATPFVVQSRQMSALDAELADLQPMARRAAQVQQRLASNAPSPAASASEAKRIGDTLQVLAAVTNALPDDTVLSDLTFRGHRVTMTGTSQQAAQLIADLSTNGLLRNPVFVAPIVRDPASGRDSFSLRAELAP